MAHCAIRGGQKRLTLTLPSPCEGRGRAPSPRWGEGGGEGKFLGSEAELIEGKGEGGER